MHLQCEIILAMHPIKRHHNATLLYQLLKLYYEMQFDACVKVFSNDSIYTLN